MLESTVNKINVQFIDFFLQHTLQHFTPVRQKIGYPCIRTCQYGNPTDSKKPKKAKPIVIDFKQSLKSNKKITTQFR